jgi:hypothetical protein
MINPFAKFWFGMQAAESEKMHKPKGRLSPLPA